MGIGSAADLDMPMPSSGDSGDDDDDGATGCVSGECTDADRPGGGGDSCGVDWREIQGVEPVLADANEADGGGNVVVDDPMSSSWESTCSVEGGGGGVVDVGAAESAVEVEAADEDDLARCLGRTSNMLAYVPDENCGAIVLKCISCTS